MLSRCTLLLAVVLSLPGCNTGNLAGGIEDLGGIEDFTLTERSGRSVRRGDLLGKVWISSFFFTHCNGPCPQISGTMARLQKEFADQEGVLLVSVSVDPERDTPEVLREYAERFRASADRWLFLTGPKDDVYRLIQKSFLLAVAPDKDDQVTHSSRLALVDKHGRLRGFFDGRQVDEEGKPVNELPRLKQAVATLLREP
jgi:cytochrome oxidase Cu insertion factor (SCO1/SenC/PrrC family)